MGRIDFINFMKAVLLPEYQNVYTIVLFETLGKGFQVLPENYLHKFLQRSDTGLKLPLLQEYLFIALDIYQKTMENRSIETELEQQKKELKQKDSELEQKIRRLHD